MNTVLNDRVLWYDGDSTVDDDSIVPLLLSGKDISAVYVEKITPEIAKYNKIAPENERIQIKKPVDFKFDLSWNIPEEYKNLDIESHILELLGQELSERGWCKEDGSFTEDGEIRIERVALELKLYKNNKLYDLLRTIIYIINTLRYNDKVWGVGRGSSVSSYVLYLIGVHDVDSVEYDLDITDFLH